MDPAGVCEGYVQLVRGGVSLQRSWHGARLWMCILDDKVVLYERAPKTLALSAAPLGVFLLDRVVVTPFHADLATGEAKHFAIRMLDDVFLFQGVGASSTARWLQALGAAQTFHFDDIVHITPRQGYLLRRATGTRTGGASEDWPRRWVSLVNGLLFAFLGPGDFTHRLAVDLFSCEIDYRPRCETGWAQDFAFELASEAAGSYVFAAESEDAAFAWMADLAAARDSLRRAAAVREAGAREAAQRARLLDDGLEDAAPGPSERELAEARVRAAALLLQQQLHDAAIGSAISLSPGDCIHLHAAHAIALDVECMGDSAAHLALLLLSADGMLCGSLAATALPLRPLSGLARKTKRSTTRCRCDVLLPLDALPPGTARVVAIVHAAPEGALGASGFVCRLWNLAVSPHALVCDASFAAPVAPGSTAALVAELCRDAEAGTWVASCTPRALGAAVHTPAAMLAAVRATDSGGAAPKRSGCAVM